MALRSSTEMFDEAQRIGQQLQIDFDRYDRRQEIFRKKFAAETRKQHQGICDGAVKNSAASASVAALFSQHDENAQDKESEDVKKNSSRRSSHDSISTGSARRQVATDKDKHPEVFRALSSFYNPPDAATDVVCELCFGFRSATMVQPLPTPWTEYCDETTRKHYFYDSSTRQVRWHPPPATDALSVLVFERTNSIYTVCHCIPSNERRRRLMQKFREHAMQMAREEVEKRDRHLRGAFISLAMSLVPFSGEPK
ncbi:WW domain [Phytophthora cactorum]|nr:WW domain [Phytophthora cactorum]